MAVALPRERAPAPQLPGLGVQAFNGLLYGADTYNHKVKVISPSTCAASDF